MPEEQTKKSKLIWIILGIVLLLLIGAAIFFLSKKDAPADSSTTTTKTENKTTQKKATGEKIKQVINYTSTDSTLKGTAGVSGVMGKELSVVINFDFKTGFKKGLAAKMVFPKGSPKESYASLVSAHYCGGGPQTDPFAVLYEDVMKCNGGSANPESFYVSTTFYTTSYDSILKAEKLILYEGDGFDPNKIVETGKVYKSYDLKATDK